jgi:hypothetical protein
MRRALDKGIPTGAVLDPLEHLKTTISSRGGLVSLN